MPSGFHASSSAAGASRREHAHVAAVRGEAAQDVQLDAEVVGRDAQRPATRALRGGTPNDGLGHGIVASGRAEVVRARRR